MKATILSCFALFICSIVVGQSNDKEFVNVYNRITSKRIFNLDVNDKIKREQDSLEVVELNQLLKVLNNFRLEQHRMNGSAGFSFSGNQSDISSLYKVGVNGAMDGGAYPYEVDFRINVQTTIQNGTFQESLSDIDVSFDFHPIIPDELTRKQRSRKDSSVSVIPNGLWMENYVFLKRFK